MEAQEPEPIVLLAIPFAGVGSVQFMVPDERRN
jgi:hypothetical protein